MNSQPNRAAIVATIVVALLQSAGCSAIGYGIGSAIDSGKGGKGEIPESKWTTLNANQRVQVFRDSGSFVTGRFYRVSVPSAADYRTRYENWRKTDPTGFSIPAPGDSIILTLETGGNLSGQLVGYDKRYSDNMNLQSGRPSERRLALAYRSRPEGVLLFRNADSTGVTRVSTKSLSRISGVSGQGLTASALSEIIVNHKMPTMAAMVITSDTHVWDIPFDRISSVVVTSEKGKARWIGLGIGIALDAALITAIIAFGDGWEADGTGIHGF